MLLMNTDRQCGILLHPTSLPSQHGIGDLGPEAFRFVDFLRESGQSLWQVLPLNPVGYGWSPYQSPSAFAGNILLISIHGLLEEGLLEEKDLETLDRSDFPVEWVDFPAVKKYKETLLKKAFAKFDQSAKSGDYLRFLDEKAYWLHDYSLFMALKEYFGGAAWHHWTATAAARDRGAMEYYRKLLSDGIRYHCFKQFIFHKQWLRLKKYANDQGIKVIGDIPIYVSYDSSDVWSNPELFKLDKSGRPAAVAGVPPDYFSKTGQLWGNPLYNWDRMRQDGYLWWRRRLENTFQLVDIARIDHFRGFEAYWEVPVGAKTAARGRWVKGPGQDFFETIEGCLGKLPVIAEDLGFITPQVVALKDRFNFMGMQVLQFAFESDEKELFNALFERNIVLYTGTHDNDTVLGWYRRSLSRTPQVARHARIFFGIQPRQPAGEICHGFIEIAYSSNAAKVIIPLQDVLCLDDNARMNTPGTATGNWQWRCPSDRLDRETMASLKDMASRYRR